MGALEIVKYVGLFLASSSAIWGLTRKLTFEDEHQNKRLTSAGYLSIFLIGMSLIGSVVALMLETLEKQQHKVAAAAAAIKTDQIAFARSERAIFETRYARDKALAAVNQNRLIAISNENKKLIRDIRLLNFVNSRTNSLLVGNANLLTQSSRLMNRIGDTSIEVTWCLSKNTPFINSITDSRFHDTVWQQLGRERGLDNDGSALIISEESSFYPKQSDIKFLTMMDVGVYVSGSKEAFGSDSELNRSFDIAYRLPERSSAPISIPREQGFVSFTTGGPIKSVYHARHSTVKAVQDLDRAVMIIRWNYHYPKDALTVSSGPVYADPPAWHEWLGISEVKMRVSDQEFTIPHHRIRRLSGNAFVVDAIGGEVAQGRYSIGCNGPE